MNNPIVISTFQRDGQSEATIYNIDLRDLFAMAALSGISADPSSRLDEKTADACYYMANRMMATRETILKAEEKV